MIAIAVNVGDKINRELRSYGANIVVYAADAALDVRIGDQQLKPAAAPAYLKESKLPSIKGMFWGHNVLAFAPFLETQATVESLPVRIVGTYFDTGRTYGVVTTGGGGAPRPAAGGMAPLAGAGAVPP